MRLLGLILLLSISQIQGQTPLDYILNLKHDSIPQLELEEDSNLLYLPMSYASANWKQLQIVLDRRMVYQVELVYTAYHHPLFDQRALNYRRLKALEQQCPQCFQPAVAWKIIAQSACQAQAPCLEFFHGFVLHLQPEISLEEEISDIEEALRQLSFASGSASKDSFFSVHELDQGPQFPGGQVAERRYFNRNLQYPETAKQAGKQGTVLLYAYLDEEGKVIDAELVQGFDKACDQEALRLIKNLPPMTAGMIGENSVPSKLRITVPFQLNRNRPSADPIFYEAFYREEQGSGTPKKSTFSSKGAAIEKEVFSKIFKRNYSWDSMAIVADLSSSMSPYTAQMMAWFYEDLQQAPQRIQHLTFFNDGDGKKDELKYLGKTGGIYHIEAQDFSIVKAEVYKCMRAGRGGDLPENNVEASLAAINACPNCSNYVLICDNFASPRDLELASQLQKPLQIILCGAQHGVNPAYLDLARQSKGSVHTANSDLRDLHQLKIGEEIVFEQRTYLLQAEGFQLKQ